MMDINPKSNMGMQLDSTKQQTKLNEDQIEKKSARLSSSDWEMWEGIKQKDHKI